MVDSGKSLKALSIVGLRPSWGRASMGMEEVRRFEPVQVHQFFQSVTVVAPSDWRFENFSDLCLPLEL